MKQFIKDLTVSDILWWLLLILIFVVVPIEKVHSATLMCSGTPIEKPWWLYILAVAVWDWFMIILLLVVFMLAAMLTKIGQWICNNKDNQCT